MKCASTGGQFGVAEMLARAGLPPFYYRLPLFSLVGRVVIEGLYGRSQMDRLNFLIGQEVIPKTACGLTTPENLFSDRPTIQISTA
jgi:hypothetical protein